MQHAHMNSNQIDPIKRFNYFVVELITPSAHHLTILPIIIITPTQLTHITLPTTSVVSQAATTVDVGSMHGALLTDMDFHPATIF